MKKRTASVMIPVYNAERVLDKALKALESQTYPISKIIIVDDASSDSSYSIALHYKKTSKFPVTVERNNINTGLSPSYNRVIRKIQSDLFITLNQDCIMEEKRAVEKLIMPFHQNQSVVESCAWQTYPLSMWEKCNFWQKCLISRKIGRTMSGRNSSFCCFSVSALKKIGLFDEKTYRTAGEDADIIARLEKIGRIVDADTSITHMYVPNENYSLADLFRKESQMAEAEGVNVIKHPRFTPINNIRLCIRPLIVLGLFIPKMHFLFLGIGLIFIFLYSKEVFIREWRNPYILLLPFINFFLLFNFTYYFFKGMITGKQVI